MRKAISAILLVTAFWLAACSKATNDSPTAAISPKAPSAPASPTPPPLVSVSVNVHCTHGLYCANIDGSSCVFSDSFKSFPSQSLTVSDPDGEILAAKSLPLEGEISGSADTGDYSCTAALTFEVPEKSLYKVDAFGFNDKTDKGPFTLSVP